MQRRKGRLSGRNDSQRPVSKQGIDPLHDSNQVTLLASSGEANKFDPNIPVALKKDFLRLGYAITGMIGKGGMGTVFKAHYVGDAQAFGISKDATVAIKLLSEFFLSNPDERTRFFREAEIVRRIKHPNVVKLFETGEIGQRPFYAMEYLEGTDVASVISKKTGKGEILDLNRALYIIREACHALAQLHAKDIIHRDIKPANIFIVKNGDERKVKLIDLGIAKVVNRGLDSGLTNEGVMLGTVVYMAPEMTLPPPEGEQGYDHRIDIYSLGVTLYEMLSGTVPFESPDYIETIHQIRTKEPEPLRKRRPDLNIPESVDELVLRCLAKNDSDRFPDVHSLIEAIEDCNIIEPERANLISLIPDLRQTEQVKRIPKLVRWGLPSLVVAGAVAAAVLSYPTAPADPQEESGQETDNKIYRARIETNVPGVSVMKEEKLESGTVVTRLLGKTPLEVPLEGEQIIFLELEGYKRAYLRITPKNNVVNHEMQQR